MVGARNNGSQQKASMQLDWTPGCSLCYSMFQSHRAAEVPYQLKVFFFSFKFILLERGREKEREHMQMHIFLPLVHSTNTYNNYKLHLGSSFKIQYLWAAFGAVVVSVFTMG